MVNDGQIWLNICPFYLDELQGPHFDVSSENLMGVLEPIQR